MRKDEHFSMLSAPKNRISRRIAAKTEGKPVAFLRIAAIISLVPKLKAHVQKYYLQLIRLEENTTDHWVNPTKCLEDEISVANYQRYKKCTSDLSENNLRSAYKELLSAARVTVENLELFQRLIDYIK